MAILPRARTIVNSMTMVQQGTQVVTVKGEPGNNGTDGQSGKDGKDGIPGKDGPQGIQGIPGKDGVTGRQGDPAINGTNGVDGKDGLPGKDGAEGKQGIQGNPGKDGLNGQDGKQGLKGEVGATGAAGKDGTKALAIRAQTDTTGKYIWTFPTAFASGVIPVIEVTVQDTGTASFNHKISALSNTSATVQLTKTTAVTILGISVLGIDTSPQAFVHITATAPT